MLPFSIFLETDIVETWGTFTMREMYQMSISKKISAVFFLQRMLKKSLVYNGLTSGIVALRRDLAISAGRKMNLKPTRSDDDFSLNIIDIIRTCRERGIKPVLVVEHQGADHSQNFDRVTDLEKNMIRIANEQGVPVLNAHRYFCPKWDWRELVFENDRIHLNENGHKLVGELIADFLVKEKVVP